MHASLPKSAVEYLSILFAISVTNAESSRINISCRNINFEELVESGYQVTVFLSLKIENSLLYSSEIPMI